ncbi:SDR family NAD(P)-dependent oxidoreductase [Clostridium sp. E02]|uniref:SDR family NAD(P)-dependent oxidoreductase n=1 Tax=Clostridium sp. E02 TaxID=2487134 RepID=UPI000F53E5F7|nr:SDR family NAD(P)-dependent oxidoreductase [Clostridium sp. E02]
MKIAIVTGASSGLGREFVLQIADRFSGIEEIWAIARRKERIEELSPLVPVKVRSFAIDLTDKNKLLKLQETLSQEKPEVKWLINAAGYGKIGAVGSVNLEDEMGMVDLNNRGLVAMTHLVLPYMSKNSRIIQFSSAASFLPQPDFAIYAASKSFVLSYSRALNEELKPKGIYVTAVCPGPVRTEFFKIAETTGHISLYKKILMADPKKVVRLAIRDSMMGRPVSVYGSTMKAFRFITKLLPHTLLLQFVIGLMKTE